MNTHILIEWPYNKPGLVFGFIKKSYVLFNKSKPKCCCCCKRTVADQNMTIGCTYNVKFDREIHNCKLMFVGSYQQCVEYTNKLHKAFLTKYNEKRNEQHERASKRIKLE